MLLSRRGHLVHGRNRSPGGRQMPLPREYLVDGQPLCATDFPLRATGFPLRTTGFQARRFVFGLVSLTKGFPLDEPVIYA
jgi:hypothetical protein